MEGRSFQNQQASGSVERHPVEQVKRQQAVGFLGLRPVATDDHRRDVLEHSRAEPQLAHPGQADRPTSGHCGQRAVLGEQRQRQVLRGIEQQKRRRATVGHEPQRVAALRQRDHKSAPAALERERDPRQGFCLVPASVRVRTLES